MGLTTATLKEQFRYLRSRIPSYQVKQSPTDLTFDQTASPGGFFVYRQQITRRKKGSQEDHWNFFYRCCDFAALPLVIVILLARRRTTASYGISAFSLSFDG